MAPFRGYPSRVDTLALTFDDGPEEAWTARLLDLLARVDARATFFPIAPRAGARPAIVARMLGEGHSVGLHCHEHVRHSTRDAQWGRADTGRALDQLREVGVTPRLWRTPWGDTAPWTADVAREHDLRIVGWTVDSHDWRGDGAEAMFASCRPGLRAGAIVLAHDGIGPGARRADPRETLSFVELVASFAADHELALAAL